MSGLPGRPQHPIEAESLRIVAQLLGELPSTPLCRAVVLRVAHATADLELARDLIVDERALRGAVEALAGGAPVVADGRFTAAGITTAAALEFLSDPRTPDRAIRWGCTRAAAAIRLAAAEVGAGALWVIGTAPTALDAVLTHVPDPALVVGLPVGWVGAVEAKAALRTSGLPAVTNRSPRGGAAAAATVVNTLVREAEDR